MCGRSDRSTQIGTLTQADRRLGRMFTVQSPTRQLNMKNIQKAEPRAKSKPGYGLRSLPVANQELMKIGRE